MHFWIDKRSQGCGYNGRYLVPLSFSGPRRNQRLLCGGVHPKLMVTPVHRFQSIESVATGGARHLRGPSYHTRFPIQCGPSLSCNASTSQARNNTETRSVEVLPTGTQRSATPRRRHSPARKFKCGVWIFFAIVTFFIAGAKYYFHGGNIGVEAFVFCSLIAMILIVGGIISFYDVINPSILNNSNPLQPLSAQISNEQQETSEENQVPNQTTTAQNTELPPPPYHIAIMLPTQTNSAPLTIVRDSPPPSYEKVVN